MHVAKYITVQYCKYIHNLGCNQLLNWRVVGGLWAAGPEDGAPPRLLARTSTPTSTAPGPGPSGASRVAHVCCVACVALTHDSCTLLARSAELLLQHRHGSLFFFSFPLHSKIGKTTHWPLETHGSAQNPSMLLRRLHHSYQPQCTGPQAEPIGVPARSGAGLQVCA